MTPKPRFIATVAAAVLWPALLTGASAAGAATDAAADARAAASGGTWGTAAEVPGTAALNKGGDAAITSVSCVSAGNCSAGGYYKDSSGHVQVFTVGEKGGTWGTAEEVPGTAALNKGGSAGISSVSCASAGNCSAAGGYTDASGHAQGFVVTEKDGTWGTALQVPGLGALNKGGIAGVTSVSCGSAGNCSAGGSYKGALGGVQGFVVGEKDGTWGTAQNVPGLEALNVHGVASISSVSCGSAGNCSAGGSYDGADQEGAFVVGEKDGTWGTAEQVPGTATPGGSIVDSVSCSSAGNCSAGGSYASSDGVFAVAETDGTWGTAQDISFPTALGVRGNIELWSLSCASAGNCSAGGTYTSGAGIEAFVVAEADGTWGAAEEVPGTATLNVGKNALTESVSCGSAGNCGAGGYYDSIGHHQAFAAGEADGTWGTAEEVAGTAALNQGGSAAITSVSCTAADHCSAGGWYRDGADNRQQAFVVDET
jgi:hypothetical protein